MVGKTILAFAAATAALAEQVLAKNSHRHLHRRDAIEKRDTPVVDWVTVYTTVTVDSVQETEAPLVDYALYVAPRPVHEKDLPAVSPVASAHTAPPALNTPLPLVDNAARTTLATYAKPDGVGSPAETYAPPAPATPSATTGQGGSGSANPVVFRSKRGIAYNSADLANTFDGKCDDCTWAYNWGSSAQGLNSQLSFVPMLWGPQDRFTKQWPSDASKAISSGAKAMFSFNEPDNAGQANLTPQQAAQAHVQYLNPYAGKVQIGSPSITNSGNPGEGIDWLKSFVSECDQLPEKCHFDFCNVHWYSPAESADTLYQHLEEAHNACGGKPVWLTEFAPVDAGGNPVNAASFLKQVLPKLDQISYLAAYAPFMCSAGKLMSSGNELSDTGKVYAGLV